MASSKLASRHLKLGRHIQCLVCCFGLLLLLLLLQVEGCLSSWSRFPQASLMRPIRSLGSETAAAIAHPSSSSSPAFLSSSPPQDCCRFWPIQSCNLVRKLECFKVDNKCCRPNYYIDSRSLAHTNTSTSFAIHVTHTHQPQKAIQSRLLQFSSVQLSGSQAQI